MKKTAIVCEGGGMRGAFTAGVLEYFMEQDFWVDEVIGVSAGASTSISYVSKQKGRCKATMLDYLEVEPYVSVKSLIKTGFLFNMDFLFDRLPNQLNPFDYDTFYVNSCEYYAGATDVETGEIKYFGKKDLTKNCEMLRASCAIPFVSKLVKVGERYYLDGGIADSIPYKKAIEDGCEQMIVILTRPRNYRKKPQSGKKAIYATYRKHPKFVEKMIDRPERYNESLKELEQLEKEGKAIIIAPSSTLELSRTEKNREKLQVAFDEGWKAGKLVLESLK